MRRAVPVLLGVVLYVAITFALYWLQRIAFPGGSGPYPVWYSTLEVILRAVAAVGPGFVAAWLHAHPGFKIGALTGVVGVFAEFAIAIFVFGMPIADFIAGLVSGLFAASIAAILTNGIAGLAAEGLRRRKQVAL